MTNQIILVSLSHIHVYLLAQLSIISKHTADEPDEPLELVYLALQFQPEYFSVAVLHVQV